MSDARSKTQAGLLPIAVDNTFGPALAPTMHPSGTTLLEEPTGMERWHPKVTPYRLLVTALVIGLGSAKALAASTGRGLVTSVTIEWISGMIVLLLTFFLAQYETKEHAKPVWFFKTDLIASVRDAGIDIPHYNTDERPLELVVKHGKPPITGYRILVSVAAVSFGVVKASLSYTGYGTAPKAVDWVYGVVVTVVLYWVGTYENALSEYPMMPWLFTRDYAKQVYPPCFVIVFLATHIVALWTAHSLSNFCFAQANGSQPEESEPTSHDIFSSASVYGYLISLHGFGIGVGVVGSCVILGSLGLRLFQWLLVFATTCWRSWRRAFTQPVPHDYYDINEDAATTLETTAFEFVIPTGLWGFSPFSTAPSGKWTKVARALAALSIVGITILYLIVHDAGREGYILSFGWTLLWSLLMRALWPWFVSVDGLGVELGYVMFTILFTHAGYIPAVLMFASPILVVFLIIVQCC